MKKSNEQVAKIIEGKITLLLMQYRPTPTCPQKQQRNNWDIEQIKKSVAGRLWPESLGINIEITP